MRRVNPFLSPVGLGITLLVTLGLVVSFWRDGYSMFNPGELTSQNRSNVTLSGFSSHAAFESQCERCHAPLETTMADLCLQCHQTVMNQIAGPVGTHGDLGNIQDCRVWHPDHRGRDYDPMAAAYVHFDHTLTGFSLIWHQVDFDTTPMDCFDCHINENGLELTPGACQSCHTEYAAAYMETHLHDFGENCLACHDGSGDMTQFNHDKTRFPLEGMHTQTRCGGCHIDGQLSNLPLVCDACHAEPDLHFGLFTRTALPDIPPLTGPCWVGWTVNPLTTSHSLVSASTGIWRTIPRK